MISVCVKDSCECRLYVVPRVCQCSPALWSSFSWCKKTLKIFAQRPQLPTFETIPLGINVSRSQYVCRWTRFEILQLISQILVRQSLLWLLWLRLELTSVPEWINHRNHTMLCHIFYQCRVSHFIKCACSLSTAWNHTSTCCKFWKVMNIKVTIEPANNAITQYTSKRGHK